MRAFADLRQGRPGQQVKIVHADPRFSVTAAKADEWLPVRPGTDAALALGIAHVLVRDGLCDKAFLKDHTFGFDDWVDKAGKRQEGFRTMVLRDYPPSRAAEITGDQGGADRADRTGVRKPPPSRRNGRPRCPALLERPLYPLGHPLSERAGRKRGCPGRRSRSA